MKYKKHVSRSVTVNYCRSLVKEMCGGPEEEENIDIGTVFLYGTLRKIHDPEILWQKTFYNKESIYTAVQNWKYQEIWTPDRKTTWDMHNEETAVIEFWLIVLVGNNEVKRMSVIENNIQAST